MLTIVAGCYEQIVLGYKVTFNEESSSYKHTSYFTDHAQSGCIRCLAAGEKFVAAGSTDETICMYDMKLGEELGALQGHSGAINQLSFPDSSHLVSCSDDGDIYIWEASAAGTLLKILKGHKGKVTSFAIHPSGKLAMSVSPKEGSLRTWNLLTGRPVFIKNMKKLQPQFVRWSPGGLHYVVASSNTCEIFEMETANCIHNLMLDGGILTMEFLPVKDHSVLAVGDGSGFVKLFDVSAGKCIKTFKAHDNRVKCIRPILPPPSFKRPAKEVWLLTVSSDGHIKLWNLQDLYLNKNNNIDAECLVDINTNARLTSVAGWHDAIGKTELFTLNCQPETEVMSDKKESKKTKRKRKQATPSNKKQKT